MYENDHTHAMAKTDNFVNPNKLRFNKFKFNHGMTGKFAKMTRCDNMYAHW